MSEFEKELEKNMKLGKVAHERESLYSDFLVSKRDIERIFEEWQPKKAKVEVPWIVADWFENNEDDLSFKIWGYLINWKLQDKKSDFFKWMKKESECIEILIRMQDGYTVKKEQLYEVVFYVDEEDDRCLLMKTGKTISFEYESQNEGHYQQQFTEAEIKAIDERYWMFAVPVEEVEP